MEEFRKYEPFFGKWRVSRELGRGAFGQVYEIYWEDDLGNRFSSALKVIHIPAGEAFGIQMEEQPNREAVGNYFRRQVERIQEEIQILQRCRGHSNIVSYEDHAIMEKEDGIGWDILIRMELLYPVKPYFARKEATQYDVIRMWLDIANALVYCEEQNIIHRDIKPANILISPGGNYKLSDFGAARKSMQSGDAYTRVGTERYMAPEVFRNQRYDKRADYYSLGCVIYYFLNKKRHVFLPPYPQEVNARDNERAEQKRVGGEKIPGIKGVSREVNAILRKSMAYRPANRYKSARELRRVLSELLEKQGDELKQRYLCQDMEKAASAISLDGVKGRTGPKKREEGVRAKSFGSLPAAVAAGFLLTAGIGGIVYGVAWKREPVATPTVTPTSAPTPAPTATPTPMPTAIPTPMATVTPTSAPTPAPTATPMPTATPTLAPTPTGSARMLGGLDRPGKGDLIEGDIKVKGWLLLSSSAGEAEVFGDLLSGGQVLSSFPLELKELGDRAFEKWQKRTEGRLAADRGYEIRGRGSSQGLPAGEYVLRLRAVERAAGLEEILETTPFHLLGSQDEGRGDVLEFMGLEGEGRQPGTSFWCEEKGFAIGLDEEGGTLTANGEQILLTGWINGEAGTSLGVYLQIDGTLYTADSVAGEGGSLSIRRTPRRLTGLDQSLVGGVIRDTSQAGILVTMGLPFLEAGRHRIALIFNVGPPGFEPEMVDMKPVTLQIDPAVPIREGEEDRIAAEWEKEPSPPGEGEP